MYGVLLRILRIYDSKSIRGNGVSVDGWKGRDQQYDPKCVEEESALWIEKGEYPGKISLDIRMTINLTDREEWQWFLQSWENFAGGSKNLLDTFCNQERI